MEGDAVSLVCIDENMLLADIETLLRQPIRREIVPGFEVNRSIPREPIRQRSVGISRGMGGGRRTPARQSAPGGFYQQNPGASRPAASPGPRPAASPAPRPAANRAAPSGFRRPAPSDFGQAAPSGFNQSMPVEPRRAPQSPPSIGYAPARRPNAGNGSAARHGSSYAGRPSNGGYRQGERRAPSSSLPGERIARSGGRPA
jgi:ATP-dependent RNA helicase RhlE